MKGRITVPYKMESSERTVASDRGVYVLEFSSKGGGPWELKAVTKQAQMRMNGTVEAPIPDDDRNFYVQRDTDFAVVQFKRTLSKVAPPPSDG
jgi:hypothetical protein